MCDGYMNYVRKYYWLLVIVNCKILLWFISLSFVAFFFVLKTFLHVLQNLNHFTVFANFLF